MFKEQANVPIANLLPGECTRRVAPLGRRVDEREERVRRDIDADGGVELAILHPLLEDLDHDATELVAELLDLAPVVG